MQHVPSKVSPSGWRFTADLFVMQKRPGHRELLANDGDASLLVIDVDLGRIRTIPLPRELHGNLGRFNWCFRSDGAELAIFGEDSRDCVIVSIDAPHRVTRTTPPGFHTSVDLRPFWTEEAFYLSGGKREGCLRLCQDGSPLRFEPVPFPDSDWARMIRAVPVDSRTVFHTSPEKKQVVFVGPGTVGWRTWTPVAAGRDVPFSGKLVSAAHDGRLFWAASRDLLTGTDDGGTTVAVEQAPEGHFWLAIEHFPADGANPGLLARVSAPIVDPLDNHLSFVTLPNGDPA